MIDQNKELKQWEANLFAAIWDLGNLESQRNSWFGQDKDNITSYNEIINSIYDFDLPRYIIYLGKNVKNNSILQKLIRLDELISNYQPSGSEEFIISDPNWVIITTYARNLFKNKTIRSKLKK